MFVQFALHSVNQRVKYILVCVVQITYCIYIHNTLQVLLAIINKGRVALVNKGRVAMIINTLKGQGKDYSLNTEYYY